MMKCDASNASQVGAKNAIRHTRSPTSLTLANTLRLLCLKIPITVPTSQNEVTSSTRNYSAMPKVVGYTPPWLSKPSAGATIFSDPEPQSPVSPSKRTSYFGSAKTAPTSGGRPNRLIASRGTEIFTVVGNKIRWADLSQVKDEWEEQNRGHKSQYDGKPYRTLVTPVYYQITQLSISPSGTFLAICTEHTIHIGILPESSRLMDHDHSPLKLKTYQLGPTTHVIPESPLASVLWHPLAAATNSTDCLVTVTTEAAVRVWEIDRSNHWSFERPALAIDLRKLADGVSSDQDFEPSGFGKNKGFSVDAFDMEASAACFGGRGMQDEDAWASMTLWTAMSNGDVYALCPLLPNKWMPTPTTVPALSISAVTRIATHSAPEVDPDEQKAAEQQYEWVQEIDNEDPIAIAGQSDPQFDEIRYRPENPSAIPRLQGPFELHNQNELDETEIVDIHVVAARLDEDALLSGEDDYEIIGEGVQFTVICLSTAVGHVLVSIELEGVSGQWLPQKGRSTFSVPTSEARDLILIDAIRPGGKQGSLAGLWPVLTADNNNVYDFFVTGTDKIASVSLADWASRIGIEVSGDGDIDTGLHTRLAVACQTTICVTQPILTLSLDPGSASTSASLFSAPTILHDLNLGEMLVTQGNNQVQAVFFDVDSFKMSRSLSIGATVPSMTPSPSRTLRSSMKLLEQELPEPVPVRAPYAPADVFYRNQMQPYEELRQRIPNARKSILADNPLRLSPACLDIMTLAHRTFSTQTSYIEKAAAELFRRCERLREELADQVKQMSELADRLQRVSSASESDDEEKPPFDERITRAQDRQKQLVQRYEALRRKSGRVGMANQELSVKEEGWIKEIETLSNTIGIDRQSTGPGSVTQRYETVRDVRACVATNANVY